MIDQKKQYKTRDGREVRIYAVDGCDPYPIHGAINVDGKWIGSAWKSDGGYLTSTQQTDKADLIEVRPRIQREVWVNVYPGVMSDCVYTDKRIADKCASKARIACVKLVIDCEEGHGLD